MTALTIRPARLLATLTIGGVLLVTAGASQASTDAAPTACHGLSPASAVGCPAEIFAP